MIKKFRYIDVPLEYTFTIKGLGHSLQSGYNADGHIKTILKLYHLFPNMYIQHHCKGIYKEQADTMIHFIKRCI